MDIQESKVSEDYQVLEIAEQQSCMSNLLFLVHHCYFSITILCKAIRLWHCMKASSTRQVNRCGDMFCNFCGSESYSLTFRLYCVGRALKQTYLQSLATSLVLVCFYGDAPTRATVTFLLHISLEILHFPKRAICQAKSDCFLQFLDEYI